MAAVKRTSPWQKPNLHVYSENYGIAHDLFSPLLKDIDLKARRELIKNKVEMKTNLILGYPYSNSSYVYLPTPREIKNYSKFGVPEDMGMNIISAAGAAYASPSSTYRRDVGRKARYDYSRHLARGLLSSSSDYLREEDEDDYLDYPPVTYIPRSFSLPPAPRAKTAAEVGAEWRSEELKHLSPSTRINIRSYVRSKSAVPEHRSEGHDAEMDYRREKATFEDAVVAKKFIDAGMEPRAISMPPVELDNPEIPRPPSPPSEEPRQKEYKNVIRVHYEDRNAEYWMAKCKKLGLEIEQLNMRVVEAETKLKTEIIRIKKKMQVHITELEMSLDVANKTNIELQNTIKKQSLKMQEITAVYEESQRQLQVTMDQYGICQRRVQSLQGELEEIRGGLDAAIRAKRTVEQSLEEAVGRVNELTTINANLTSIKTKLEQELGTLAGDYDEATKELRLADDRAQKTQVELTHTIDILHEEQEKVTKIETIRKTLETEVKSLTIRLEEVESSALVTSKRAISKLESRLRDMELELDEERRRHAETVKNLRKRERSVKEYQIQTEEDTKSITLLQETVDKMNEKIKMYKRQLEEQEGMSQTNLTRVRRFQRELEAAEQRAENAESNLSLIRTKHRTFVTSFPAGTSQVTYSVEEQRTTDTY